jgi:hypothetical protein
MAQVNRIRARLEEDSSPSRGLGIPPQPSENQRFRWDSEEPNSLTPSFRTGIRGMIYSSAMLRMPSPHRTKQWQA